MADELEMIHDPQVAEIAQTLIAEHHPHLSELTILYLRTTQEKKTRGKVVYAEVKRLGVLDRFLSSGEDASLEDGADFAVICYGDSWGLLTPKQKAAAVDHCLCSVRREQKAKRDGELVTTWKLAAPDASVFYGEVERWGFWNRDLREFGTKIRQMPLGWDVVPPEEAPAAEQAGGNGLVHDFADTVAAQINAGALDQPEDGITVRAHVGEAEDGDEPEDGEPDAGDAAAIARIREVGQRRRAGARG